MQNALSRVMCSALLDAGASGTLPTEFRIFKAGANETSKGTTIFDAQAAADVMAQYAKEGVDLMIDLEHESADEPIRSDSRDARGWFQLEMRNGDLWAVNVRWTPDGARRLSERTQRYISPLFYERKEDGRVAWLVNVALVGNPATYGAAPLVAASKFGARTSTVIRSRVTRAQAERFIRLAKAMRTTQGQLLRGLVALATDASKDPLKQIRALAGFLGLPEDSSPEDVQDAVRAIAEDAVKQEMRISRDDPPPAGADPLAAVADMPFAPSSDEAQAAGDKATRRVQKVVRERALAAEIVALRRQCAVLKRDLGVSLRRLSSPLELAPDAMENLLRLLRLPADASPDQIREKAKTYAPYGDVAKALGLPGTTPERVASAIEQLLATTVKPWWEPAAKRLSADTLAACKKAGITPEEFVKRRVSIVRRA